MMRAVLLAVVISLAGTTPGMTQTAERAVRADSARTITRPPGSFDVIARDSYLRRHAYSLDNYLELEPGGLVSRLGPIGNEAFYSRLGIGRGRALVMVNGIPMNDPQDGVAPFAHLATSGIASLVMDPEKNLTFAPAIEGSISLHDLAAPADRPTTFIELTKGTNELRQRRVRFGSQAGPIGLDMSYDEVLDDGYDFDANGVVPNTPPEGAANTRNAAIAVRGEMPDRTRYTAGIRRFRSSTSGDLQSALNEGDRSGHLAWASVGLAGAEAIIYGRGYRTTRTDSTTANESVGATVAWDLHRGDATLHMFALGEHTDATQDIDGADAHDRIDQGNAGASTELTHGGFTWFAHAVAGGADGGAMAWGAGVGATRKIALGDITISGRRSFRLPTIAERYLPLHARDGVALEGNRDVDPESAFEGSVDWTVHVHEGITNRIRGSWMRSQDYIAFVPAAGDTIRRAANSGETPAMTFLEDRLGVGTNIGAVEVVGNAAARWSSGDRVGLFLSAPRAQASASLMCGMQLFDKTSALYVGGEYAFVDERHDYNGALLPSYNVVNVSVVGRLIDAHFYIKWLNVLDERYQTVSGYLMTPRTFAYGIEWTLFN